jgi:type I restriction enzyme, S subunit
MGSDLFDNVMKETELGPVPSEWAVVPIDAIAKQTQYGLSKRGEPKGAFPILRMNNLQAGKIVVNDLQFVDLEPKEFGQFRLNPGDILFNRTNSFELVGKTSLFDLHGDFVFASYLVRLAVDNAKMLPDFLNFFLNDSTTQQRLKQFATRGVSQSNINASKLRTLVVLQPPLPEQRAIAHVLRTVQRAKEATEQVIAAARHLKRSLLRHLFTYGPIPVDQADRVKLKETEIGPVPEHWTVRNFEDFATLQRGQDLPKYDFKPGEIPVIGATSIIGYHNEANVKGPGVTVVRSGSSAGLPLYVDRDFWAHNVVLFVKNFHGNHAKFAYYRILTLKLTQYRAGVAVPTLNRNTFKNIQVPLPPIDEQEEIVSLLDGVDLSIAQNERKQNALESLFRSLLHHLMTGKVRVKELEVPMKMEGVTSP